MSVAKQFIKQLQEGNTTEAIKTITTSLQERTVDLIEEKKIEILESYGFIVKKSDEETTSKDV